MWASSRIDVTPETCISASWGQRPGPGGAPWEWPLQRALARGARCHLCRAQRTRRLEMGGLRGQKRERGNPKGQTCKGKGDRNQRRRKRWTWARWGQQGPRRQAGGQQSQTQAQPRARASHQDPGWSEAYKRRVTPHLYSRHAGSQPQMGPEGDRNSDLGKAAISRKHWRLGAAERLKASSPSHTLRLPGPICKCTVRTTRCLRKTEKWNISATSTNQDVTSPGIAASADGELASPEGHREEGALPTSSHQTAATPRWARGKLRMRGHRALNFPGSAGDTVRPGPREAPMHHSSRAQAPEPELLSTSEVPQWDALHRSRVAPDFQNGESLSKARKKINQ